MKSCRSYTIDNSKFKAHIGVIYAKQENKMTKEDIINVQRNRKTNWYW